MKKLLLLLVCMLMTASGIQAQNANRSGFIVELQGGAAFGEVLYRSFYSEESEKSMLKGGVVGSLDVGYRWATSGHFAFGAKLGVWSDFAEFGKTLQIRILPGMRWTSKDFGNKNMSAYISFNTGFALSPSCYEIPVFVPLQLGVGVNLSTHFYAGIVFDYSICVFDHVDCKNYNNYHTYDILASSYPALSIKLGYRF